MPEKVSDVAFSPAVKAVQTRLGSRAAYARRDQKDAWRTRIDDDLAAFIAGRDSFYLATASADGQPYIQHRGGPAGFVKVLDDRTLAFADFAGNQQYITIGNASENDKAFIFFMDYANRRRVKLWGRLSVLADDPALLERLAPAAGEGIPQRAILFQVELWDINCPQHITPRFTEADLAAPIGRLHARIAELEAEIAAIRGENKP